MSYIDHAFQIDVRHWPISDRSGLRDQAFAGSKQHEKTAHCRRRFDRICKFGDSARQAHQLTADAVIWKDTGLPKGVQVAAL